MKGKNRILVIFLVLLCSMSLVFAGGNKDKTPAGGSAAAASAVDNRPDTNFINPMAKLTRPSVGGRQIVQAGSPLAAMAGYNILNQGGTAFDAAVAIAAVQGIAEPALTSILGGDAEILVWSAAEKKMYTYNGTGWAPKAATVDYYLEQNGLPEIGVLSIQIPGAWAGWMLMLENHGTLSLETIMAPAVYVATEFVTDPFMQQLKINPASANKELVELFTVNGQLFQEGDILRNPNLVKTFNNLVAASKRGRTNQDGYRLANDYFYRGPIAETMVRWNNANGGIFHISDFNEFYGLKQTPWSTTYKGYDVYVCPPNCQGPVLLEALNMLENYDLQKMGHNTAEYVDLLTQVLNLALQDRNQYYGDPAFVDTPKYLISKEYAKDRIKDIHLGRAMTEIPDGGQWIDFESKGGDTTFMYVADKWGNVVASTHSICNGWGSAMAIGELGVVMNNRMKYFTLDESLPNVLEPRKRTMQTITPTIAVRNGAAAFAVGTPGADIQEQSKLQVLLNALEWGLTNPQRAIESARFVTNHPAGLMNPTMFPRRITLEPWGFSDEDIKKLESYGYEVRWGGGGTAGSIGFAWFNHENGFKYGGADPRRDAYAIAW